MWAGGPADISGSRISKEVIICSYTREGDWQNTSLGPTSQVQAIHWGLQCHQCALLECRSIYYYNTQWYRHLGWLSFHWLHNEPTKPLVPNSTLVDQISITPYQITTTHRHNAGSQWLTTQKCLGVCVHWWTVSGIHWHLGIHNGNSMSAVWSAITRLADLHLQWHFIQGGSPVTWVKSWAQSACLLRLAVRCSCIVSISPISVLNIFALSASP